MNMKKIYKLLVLLLSFLIFTNTNASDINIMSVNTLDSKNIEIIIDNEIDTNMEEVSWDVSLFKDLEIVDTSLQLWETNKVKLELKKPLEANTSYSILSFAWVTWDMNFEIWLEFVWKTILNDSFDQNIKQILIVDEYSILITYKENIESDNFEIKLLKDIKVDNLFINDINKSKVNASFLNQLEEESNYILMSYNLETQESNTYNFLNPIFDFSTHKFEQVTEEKIDLNSAIDKEFEENLEENKKVTTEDVIQNIEETIEGDIEPMLSWKIEEVALNSAETPDTWAEINVLIILTFIVTSIVFLRKKFAR